MKVRSSKPPPPDVQGSRAAKPRARKVTKRKAAKKREEETMRKLGDVSVAKLLWFAGVSFAVMALWTWYMYTS